MSVNVADLTMDEIAAGLRSKSFRAEEIAQAALKFAEAENPKTNAYLTFAPERALAAARKVERRAVPLRAARTSRRGQRGA